MKYTNRYSVYFTEVGMDTARDDQGYPDVMSLSSSEALRL